jgi:hypothetical protein
MGDQPEGKKNRNEKKSKSESKRKKKKKKKGVANRGAVTHTSPPPFFKYSRPCYLLLTPVLLVGAGFWNYTLEGANTVIVLCKLSP